MKDWFRGFCLKSSLGCPIICDETKEDGYFPRRFCMIFHFLNLTWFGLKHRAGPPNLIFHGFSRVHRQAISVRQQLLGDDHEEFLRSIESYAWEPVEGWCQDLWGFHLWEMNIIYNSDKPTFFGGFSKFQ